MMVLKTLFKEDREGRIGRVSFIFSISIVMIITFISFALIRVLRVFIMPKCDLCKNYAVIDVLLEFLFMGLPIIISVIVYKKLKNNIYKRGNDINLNISEQSAEVISGYLVLINSIPFFSIIFKHNIFFLFSIASASFFVYKLSKSTQKMWLLLTKESCTKI